MISRRNMFLRVALLIFCVLLVLGCSTSRTSTTTITTPISETAIVYSRVGDIELKLDIASPSVGKGPFPALVFFCGNAWGYYSSINRTQYSYAIRQAAEKGYVAVTADYRSTNLKKDGKVVYRFPDQVFDAKCAIRWLRANADKYRIDPDRVGVIGWSSGGYLALMLGLTDPSDGLEGSCGDMSISTRVQAVVSLAGPTELVSLFKESHNCADMIDFMGGTPEELPEQYYKASPLTYVSRDDPPVLTLQGSVDNSVLPNQAALLDAKMREVGASHTLIIKEMVGHCNFYYDPLVWAFMEKHLKPGD
jgi:acetyl esterase/lipase